MQKYIFNTGIVIISLYVIFAGLAAIAAVLGWASWDEIRDGLYRGLYVAVILFGINVIVALLTHLLPKPDHQTKKK